MIHKSERKKGEYIDIPRLISASRYNVKQKKKISKRRKEQNSSLNVRRWQKFEDSDHDILIFLETKKTQATRPKARNNNSSIANP
jgi:hypothetical protein